MITTIAKIAVVATVAMSLEAGIRDAHAQNCRDIPDGPFRYQCRLKKHPGLDAIRDKCFDEARAMDFHAGEGHQNQVGVGVGPIANYVRACIRRATSGGRARS